MDVLPTPWSPKKTSLYFANGEMFGAAPADTAWLIFSPVDAVDDVAAIIYWYSIIDGNDLSILAATIVRRLVKRHQSKKPNGNADTREITLNKASLHKTGNLSILNVVFITDDWWHLEIRNSYSPVRPNFGEGERTTRPTFQAKWPGQNYSRPFLSVHCTSIDTFISPRMYWCTDRKSQLTYPAEEHNIFKSQKDNFPSITSWSGW